MYFAHGHAPLLRTVSSPMPETRPPFAELLDCYRKKLGWSWARVDREAGVERDARSKWISGRTPNPPLFEVARIVRALDVPPDKFLAAVVDDQVYEEGLERRGDIETRLRALEATLASPALAQLLADKARADAAIEDRRVREAGSEPAG